MPISEEKPLARVEQADADGFTFVAIGASAGGLAALTRVLSALPADFGAPIAIVQHLDPHYRSLIPQILGRRTRLTVCEVTDGAKARCGYVHIAPPDYHLLVDADSTFSLTQTDLVHFVRPSIDLLFESLARSFRQRALAVILTGSGSDGSTGVRATKAAGGLVVVQDETTAEFRGMPSAALGTDCVDLVLPLEDIAPALTRLVGKRAIR